MNSRNAPLIILLALAVAFGLGILELFKLRFESGDVYPAYSSLRADPLGASAFYESLARVPGISVSRDFQAGDRLPDGKGVAYLHLAGEPGDWEELPEDSLRTVENFVKMGGRLVVAFYPTPARRRISRFDLPEPAADKNKKPDEKPGDPRPPEPGPPKPVRPRRRINENPDELVHLVPIGERWGVFFDVKEMTQGADGAYVPLTVVNHDEPSLPESMTWHSGAVLTNLDKNWRVIYARGTNAVLAERRLGSGTLIFSTDSYFFSNEAMQKDRQARLLAWIVGPAREVMFDEVHLGIVDNPGIAALVRKYRLHGLVAGMLLLAGLFIWKNSTGFGPVRAEDAPEAFVAGRDSAAGFINLLRHHIQPQDILNTCVVEWKKSQAAGGFSAARIARVEELMRAENALPPRDRNPVRTYLAIWAILKKGSESRAPVTESPASSIKI